MILRILREWTIDAVGFGVQPKINYNRNWMIFYFIYGIIAKFLLINIIIAILVEKYIASKEKLGKKHLNFDI